MPSMLEKRYRAEAILDPEDNMWVLGGTHDSQSILTSEVYVHKTGSWRKGRNLPSDLRDSGLDSFCAVKLNKTHIFIAGGYARAYKVEGVKQSPNEPADDTIDYNDDSKTDGGIVLNKSWMYNGFDWTLLPSMTEARDRPACTSINLPNGNIGILVAGGCKGWCVKNQPLKSAEVFDLKTEQWYKVADLPVPLGSARLTHLDGLPSIVGGSDGTKQNENVYQYHVDQNQWIAHSVAKLRIPRSSAAVFQVPKALFRNC